MTLRLLCLIVHAMSVEWLEPYSRSKGQEEPENWAGIDHWTQKKCGLAANNSILSRTTSHKKWWDSA